MGRRRGGNSEKDKMSDKVWILDAEMDAANEAAMTATAAVHGVKPVLDTLAEPGPYRLNQYAGVTRVTCGHGELDAEDICDRLNSAFELARITATELVALRAENLRLRGVLSYLENL
jgi:hypothetical protein